MDNYVHVGDDIYMHIFYIVQNDIDIVYLYFQSVADNYQNNLYYIYIHYVFEEIQFVVPDFWNVYYIVVFYVPLRGG